MKELFRHKRQHTVEAARTDEAREDPESRAQAAANVGSPDIKLIVGPPGCCGTSEVSVRKQPQRA